MNTHTGDYMPAATTACLACDPPMCRCRIVCSITTACLACDPLMCRSRVVGSIATACLAYDPPMCRSRVVGTTRAFHGRSAPRASARASCTAAQRPCATARASPWWKAWRLRCSMRSSSSGSSWWVVAWRPSGKHGDAAGLVVDLAPDQRGTCDKCTSY